MIGTGNGNGEGHSGGCGRPPVEMYYPQRGQGWGDGYTDVHQNYPTANAYLSGILQGIHGQINYKYPQYYLTNLVDKLLKETLDDMIKDIPPYDYKKEQKFLKP